MRFVIDAPPYRNTSAGVRVLHRLCHLLNEAGEDARLTTDVRHPHWNTKPPAPLEPGDVAIYPETVAGNPLGARRIVRYFVLGRPNAIAPAAAASDQQLVVYLYDAFHEVASTVAGMALPESHRLEISVLEPDIFYPGRGLRLIDCVYVGRGAERARRFPQHAPFWRYRIDKRPSTREGLAALLRRTRTLYSYDRGSALTFEAAICGARLQIVGDDGELSPCVPWETHDLVREWWERNPANVRRFVALVRERWPELDQTVA